MTGAEFQKAQVVLRDYPGQYTWARCIECNDPATHFVQKSEDEFYLFCDKHAPDYAESLKDTAIIPGARAMPSHPAEPREAFLPENLLDTVSKLSGPGFAKLRSSLGRQFGIRLQSEGDAATADPLTLIIMQTLDASPENPYIVTFDQFILDPFTGAGQFDLVERDSSDDIEFDGEGNVVSPPESEVTIATKSGFTDVVPVGGWSRLVKAITVDKVYRVVFAPGSVGDGVYSITVKALHGYIDPDQTPAS